MEKIREIERKKNDNFYFFNDFFLKKKNLFSIEKYPKKFEKNLTNFFAIFVFEGMKAQIGSDISWVIYTLWRHFTISVCFDVL